MDAHNGLSTNTLPSVTKSIFNSSFRYKKDTAGNPEWFDVREMLLSLLSSRKDSWYGRDFQTTHPEFDLAKFHKQAAYKHPILSLHCIHIPSQGHLDPLSTSTTTCPSPPQQPDTSQTTAVSNQCHHPPNHRRNNLLPQPP